MTAAVEVARDIPYASGSDAQKLDLHRSAGAGDRLPLVDHDPRRRVQDGRQDVGATRSPRSSTPATRVASLDYRLSGEAPYPAAVQDVKAAVRFLRADAAALGLDPDRFGAFGGSAGGYLACMLGVTAATTRFDDPALGHPASRAPSRPWSRGSRPIDFLTMDDQHRANEHCRSVFQPHDDADSPESRWMGAPIQTIPDPCGRRARSPTSSRGRELPPFHLEHGDRDCSVPGEQTGRLAAALTAVGADVTHRVVEGAGHATALPGRGADAGRRPLPRRRR